jgi:Ca2+-binding RTX toxin-like protein
LIGGAGDDFLAGQEGSDTMDGGAGNDTLGWGGGGGQDTLTGGTGADRFEGGPWSWTDQQRDDVRITDFESGIDKLDLSRFDADESTVPGVIRGNKTPGNEAFSVVSSTDGVTAGHLVITTGLDALGQPVTLVQGYTNSAPGADIVIVLSGWSAIGGAVIGAGDILL